MKNFRSSRGNSLADSLKSLKKVERVADEEVYNYALRVAYLTYLMQPKPVDIPSNTDQPKEQSRLSGALGGSIIPSSLFSIGDLFKDIGRDGPKSVKFPEKLLKALDSKMQNIAMGKDPGYTDQHIRRTIAVFWGSLKDPTFYRQMKENRKIEELILMFVTTATQSLKKDPQLAGNAWKAELNNQIAQFIRILRQCLNTVHHVPPELTARLDMYTAKLVPKTMPQVDTASSSASDSGYSSSRAGDGASSPGLSTSVMDMPLVQTISRLFGYTTAEVQRDINTIKRFCTEQAALQDLKTCLKNINAGLPFPARKEDFPTDSAYQHWRTQELAHLSQLMVIMIQFNPELAKSAPSEALPTSYSSPTGRPESMYVQTTVDSPVSRHGSVNSRYSLASPLPNAYPSVYPVNGEAVGDALSNDDDTPSGFNFTYIPPNTRKFYKRLIELCIEYDLKAMSSLPEDQEVSLTILSPRHLEVINECSLRWRIVPSYRVTCFLDVIKHKYEREEVPIECIPEGLQMIQKTMHDLDLEMWPNQDADYLAQIYAGLFNVFLGSLYHALDDISRLKRDDITTFLTILEQVRDSGLLERFNVNVDERLRDICDRVRVIAVHRYTDEASELRAQPGVNRALPLLLLTDWLEKQAKLLDKRIPEPLLGKIDLVALVLESQVPLFISDLENSRKQLLEGSMNQPTPDVPIEDIFALYRRTKTVLEMHEAFCPSTGIDFDLVNFFEPYIRQWLSVTDNKTAQWVNTAISVDKFEAEGAEGHSSSIVDLFESLRSPIDFILDLKWSDPYQEARFFTNVSRTISKSIELYCRSVEELFMEEMFPRPVQEVQTQKQTSAWIEKAKIALQTEKKVEPFNFTAASCVKLNNIDAARKLLDGMYARMDADHIAEVVQNSAPPVPEKGERERFLFTAKVVLAENLVPLDGSPSSRLDSFITLSDEKGNRMAKTRTIYESLEPRWDETFDISVDAPLWLMVTVRDRNLVGKHDTVGRAYLCLDPRRYGDFLAHELWFDLDTHGRVLLRVSMEGEKDDIQFYFGRAFRSLKRAETDMVRIFIDKMSPFIRQSLSRNVLKALVKTGGVTLSVDYNKALGNVTAFYRSAIGSNASDIQIPLPPSDKPKIRPESLSDNEIEQAIGPLLDYLDANLHVLNNSLSDSTKETVMIRVWKEILVIIEGLLIPPLSQAPSDMKPLSEKEVDIVFKWLKFLRDFFYANGESPVTLEQLQNQKYRDVLSIRLYYDWHSDELMEECVRMMQQNLRNAPSVKKRAKTVYSQRNLGTIKDRKREKRQQTDNSNGETIMRILRMRPGTADFIAQQLQIMSRIQIEQEQQQRSAPSGRRVGGGRTPIPPVPPLPSS